jgi:hypothetical protein
MEANDRPPYRDWNTICAACGKVTLARPCAPRQPIEPIEQNPVVKCQHEQRLLPRPIVGSGSGG